MSGVNIALGKTADMSSSYASNFVASHGNGGSNKTFFPAAFGNLALWAVDFGQAKARVTINYASPT